MDAAKAVAQIRRVTWVGLALNVGLTVVKGVVGVACASQALVADAVHSSSDLVTDFAILLGVKFWEAPPDDEHPYGHGKIQALVTLFIAIALALVAWELGISAVETLRGESVAKPGIAAFVAAVASVVSKELLFRWTRRVAQAVRSPALEANAWHHRSDALSSVPVAVSVVGCWIFPSLWWLDAVGALVVALFLAKVVWEIAHPALQELIDAGIESKSAQVEAVALKVPGVLAVHRCRARRYGGLFQADLHVQVESRLTVGAAHTLGHEVERAIKSADIDVSDAIIHVEPKDVRAIVSLGSNVEPRRENIGKALAALSDLPCTHLVKSSEIVETEPVDVPVEYANQKFLNAVAVFETALEPLEFSRRMHAIEDRLGRVRTVRNGPRTIDIDLIDYDGLRMHTPELILPHPRAKSRDFVTKPLSELGIELDRTQPVGFACPSQN